MAWLESLTESTMMLKWRPPWLPGGVSAVTPSSRAVEALEIGIASRPSPTASEAT
jgi:hypothetical protein